MTTSATKQDLFDSNNFAECLKKCEQELKFATTAQDKFNIQLLASKCCIELKAFDKASLFAENACVLDDSKMAIWQTLSVVYSHTNDSLKQANALAKQMQIARKNQNVERAIVTGKESARLYENLEMWIEAVSRWRDVESLTEAASTTDFELLEALARVLEKAGNVREAEHYLWKLLEMRKDKAAVVTLLSRPAHTILEARRAQSVSGVQDVNAAWDTLNERLKRITMQFSPNEPLLFGTRLALRDHHNMDINSSEDDADIELALRIVQADNLSSLEQERASVLARSWFLLARYSLKKGDPVACFVANQQAEQFEQSTYAKGFQSSSTSSQSQGATTRTIVIGPSSSTFSAKPFLGTEVYSLIAGRTSKSLLVAGRACLCYFPKGVRAALREAERHSRDGLVRCEKSLDAVSLSLAMREDLLDLSKQVEMLNDVVNGSRGAPIRHDVTADVSSQHQRERTGLSNSIERLRNLHVDESLLKSFAELASHSTASWFHRRLASLLHLVAHVLFEEASVPRISTGALQLSDDIPILAHSDIRRVLKEEEDWAKGEAAAQAMCVLWKQRLLLNSNSFDVPTLTDMVCKTDPDGFPLAYEMIGRYYMGIVDIPCFQIPLEQPQKKMVKDGANAVRNFQRCIALDPCAVGSVAALANAFHSAGKENDAATLYQKVLDFLATSSSASHPLQAYVAMWTWQRLGQQQLHQEKFVQAATSFQRALVSFGRADQNKDAELWSGLGEAHFRMGRLGAAAQAFEKAVEILRQQKDEHEAMDAQAREDLKCACLIKIASIRAKQARSGLSLDPLREVLESKRCTTQLHDITELLLAETQLDQGRYLGIRGAIDESRLALVESCKLFTSFTLRNSLSAAGWKGLGDALSELQERKEARTSYLKCCFLEPWDSLARFDVARHMLTEQGGSSPAIISQAEAAVCLNPLDAQAWALLGVARRDDLLVSQHCFVRALQLDPTSSSSPWLNLGWTFVKANRTSLAKRAFSQAQTIESDSSLAWLGHAVVTSKENRVPHLPLAALECAVDATGYDSTDAHSLQGFLLLGKALVKEINITFPQQTRRRQLGNRLLDIASRAMQHQNVTVSTRSSILTMVAAALVALGDVAQALDNLEKAAELFVTSGDFANADCVLIDVAILSPDTTVGLSIMEMALQRTPTLTLKWQTWMSLAAVQMRAGSHEAAVTSSEKAIELYGKELGQMDSNLILFRLRIRWIKAMLATSKENSDFALESVRSICPDLVQQIPKSIPLFVDLGSLSSETGEIVKQVGIAYPPLSIGGDEELAISLVNLHHGESSLVPALLFPWSSERWAKIRPSLSAFSAVEGSAARTALKLYDHSMVAASTSTVFECGRRVVRATLQYPSTMQTGSVGYWDRNTIPKLRHLCPWVSLDEIISSD